MMRIMAGSGRANNLVNAPDTIYGPPTAKRPVSNRTRSVAPGYACLVGNSSITRIREESPVTRQMRSLQPGVLRLGFLQNGDIRIGVFPEVEEVLIRGAGFSGIAC